MLGKTMISVARTIDITAEHSWKMEIYCEHPKHCKVRRYGVELCGTVGKDVAKHQRSPTSCYEERCYEPLSDADHPAKEIQAKEVSSEDPCEKGKPGPKVPWSHQ